MIAFSDADISIEYLQKLGTTQKRVIKNKIFILWV